MTFMVFALQAQITGVVVDADSGEPLIGASVLIKGTSIGTITDVDGSFSLNRNSDGACQLEAAYLGYQTVIVPMEAGVNNAGNIQLREGFAGLEEVVITGIVDVARGRRTPVAVSTISKQELEKIGNQEMPELLNSTPSVYATKSGGGYGDSRINIRGFDQRNVAVLINGVPVNDMENGRVYWSNWAGLSDVTTAMQVQRGLGSSKLAISSVGGTINILTKTTDKEKGGAVSATIGNDGYLKTLVSYSTGKNESGFASSVLLSRTAGDGYVQGTKFEGYNYFLGLGWDKGNNNFQFTVTGAPQTHNQRTTSFYNMATLADYQKFGNKYNYNHGTYNGEEFNWRRNFYHKPIASLNWDLKLNEKSKISTVAYASFGRGGGTGDIGRLGGNFASSSKFRDANGAVLWDKIAASNGGEVSTFSNDYTYGNELDPITNSYIVNDDEIRAGDIDGEQTIRRNGVVRRASMNSHNWIGLISNFKHKLTSNLKFDIGVDLRTYKGIHYRRLDNLLGADGYRDNDDVNNPYNIVTQENESNIGGLVNVFKSIDDEVKVNYYNEGLVNWLGAFTQLEYTEGSLSAFVQAAASQQGFKRIDFFRYAEGERESEWENILGGNIKGGANYNLNDNHNLFFNAGYYSKQPRFAAIYLDNDNFVNDDYRNEKIVGLEIGYGYISEDIRVNLNAYRTTWNDRFISISNSFDVNGTPDDDDDDIQGSANLTGVEQVHTGIELDAAYKINDMISLTGMVSVGNWVYGGDVTGSALDDNGNKVGELSLFLDGVKVGDAAQSTARLGLTVQPINNLYIDASVRNASNLYAAISADDFDAADHNGSLKLPSYSLVDAGISYKLPIGDNGNGLNFRLNVNNLFDTEYISESATNYFPKEGDETFNGIATNNKVFFGFGRTWNTSIRYNF